MASVSCRSGGSLAGRGAGARKKVEIFVRLKRLCLNRRSVEDKEILAFCTKKAQRRQNLSVHLAYFSQPC